MLEYFATETTEASPGLLQALGIDWKLLLVQGIAFLILVGVLAKFVYPVLVKTIDERREAIEAGLKEAKEAEEALARAEAKVADTLAQARKDADDMLARTQQESAAIIAEAEQKAKERAGQILAAAHEQLEHDVTKARKQLRRDTIELVALATERVIGEKLNGFKDDELIRKALGEEGAA